MREFDVVTMDRVKKIEVQPEFSVWKEYAYKSNIHGAIISYLTAKPSYFYQMEMTVDGMFFSTPRGWEDLSNMLYVYEKQEKEADWEVVVQYIQYPKIAKDFANYLELYHRYRSDYRMDEVLEGKINERIKKKLNHASFDERLSIVSILLAKLTEQFRQAYRKEKETEVLFKCLKRYKNNLEFGKDAISCLEEIKEQEIETLEYKKKAELLKREEKYIFSRTIQTLESYTMVLKRENLYEKEEGFEKIRSLFAKEKESYTNLEDVTEKILENAFDFMEIMFGNSQEMVSFVTELNANFYSMWFLQEYSCERYYQYNKNVLFEEREQNLLKRIENL